MRQLARGTGSGIDVEMQVAYLYEIRAGALTRFHIYLNWQAAMAAAGRFAGELEPAE